jgi:hypothetical protein
MIRIVILALIISVTEAVAAAATSHAQAQIELGLLYLYGAGVPRDHGRALMWFYVAAARHPETASRYVRLIEPLMSRLQIEQARELADHCIDSGFDDHECSLYGGDERLTQLNHRAYPKKLP